MKGKTIDNKLFITGWCLFDLANSIPAVIGGIYFSKWFVIDLGSNQVTYNLLFFISIIIIIVFGKKIGSIIDLNGTKRVLLISVLLIFISNILLYIVSNLFINNSSKIILSSILFVSFMVGYQTNRIVINTILKKYIKEDIQAKLSGFGVVSNWIGSLIGISTCFALSDFLNLDAQRSNTFILSSLLFLFVNLIALFFTYKKISTIEKLNTTCTESNNSNGKINYNIYKVFGISMLGYIFLFDCLQIVEKNLPNYLTIVHKMNDQEQNISFLVILLCAAAGGFISSFYLKAKNSFKFIILGSGIFVFSLVLLHIVNMSNLVPFVLAGIAYGTLESSMRIHFLNFFSAKNSGKYFGIFAIFERSGGLLGAFLWSAPFAILNNQIIGFDIAIYSVIFLIIASIGVFLFDKNRLNRFNIRE